MNRFYGFAFSAGLACFLAVIYTLLHAEWGQAARAEPAAIQGSAVPGNG